MKPRFVVGLLFNHGMTRMVLVRKLRPEWQFGKLNGIGGKIERGETPHTAMVRECWEEIGLHVPEWRHFLDLKLTRDDGKMWCFFSFADLSRLKPKELWKTDEPIEIHTVSKLMDRKDMIPSLRWIIQMARSWKYGETIQSFVAREVPKASIK